MDAILKLKAEQKDGREVATDLKKINRSATVQEVEITTPGCKWNGRPVETSDQG